MKKQPHILISAALLAASVQPVFAGLSLTPLQTVVFSQVDDGTFTDFPGPFIGLTAGEPLTGFTKFDPSLGTLKEIRVSAEIAASVDVTLFVDEVTDASQPFTAFFEETVFAGGDSLLARWGEHGTGGDGGFGDDTVGGGFRFGPCGFQFGRIRVLRGFQQ